MRERERESFKKFHFSKRFSKISYGRLREYVIKEDGQMDKEGQDPEENVLESSKEDRRMDEEGDGYDPEVHVSIIKRPPICS